MAVSTGTVRLALLLGNRNYPEPFDLPPILKNVHDVDQALRTRGFDVSDGLDLDPAAARLVLDAFVDKVRHSPDDAVVFFYFSGHGVQVDASNLLLPAGLNPSASSDTLLKGSVQLLRDVILRIPERQNGMTIAVVDACRTSLKASIGGTDEGLNQVEAPPGCLIAFSTGAGRPAIAPAVDTVNTFYTGSLVKIMNSLSGEVTFSDLFRLVKADVERTMSNHPVEAIRKLTQRPFIAENTKVRVPLALRAATAEAAASAAGSGHEDVDWAAIEASTWPAEVVQLSESFLKTWPSGRFNASAQVAHDGAEEALRTLKRSDVRLYRSAFQPPADASADIRRDVYRAARGDKDAAARLGRRAMAEGSSPAASSRYEGWLQFATALGNGIAAYELALHYRGREQPLLAGQFEARARELGYNPPPTLDNVRK
jgi:hypothetical protein